MCKNSNHLRIIDHLAIADPNSWAQQATYQFQEWTKKPKSLLSMSNFQILVEQSEGQEWSNGKAIVKRNQLKHRKNTVQTWKVCAGSCHPCFLTIIHTPTSSFFTLPLHSTQTSEIIFSKSPINSLFLQINSFLVQNFKNGHSRFTRKTVLPQKGNNASKMGKRKKRNQEISILLPTTPSKYNPLFFPPNKKKKG